MKIYTEINYEWKDGHLVETSSNSFDYYGLIERCGGGGGSVVPKIKLPDATIKLPDISDIKLPEIKTPKVKLPEVKVKVPEVKVKVPEVKVPKIKVPVIKPPVIKPPVIKVPEIKVPTASDISNTATGALGEVGKGLGKITGAVTEGISTGTSAIGAEASSAGQAATTNVSNLGTGSGGTTGQVASGVMHGGEQISTGVTSGITQGLSAVETGISTGVENIGGTLEDIKGGIKYYKNKVGEKLGVGKLIGGLQGMAEEMVGKLGGETSKYKRDAPGSTESMGAGGQGGMKSATMGAVKKTTAGSGGKRRLRKVSRSGAKV